MRYEQFQIDVDDEGVVFIRQDGGAMEEADVVMLRVHQIPAFIEALTREIAKAKEGR